MQRCDRGTNVEPHHAQAISAKQLVRWITCGPRHLCKDKALPTHHLLFIFFVVVIRYNIVQTDIVRLGGLSEFLVVALMASKFKKKICLHAGGVGLCNYAAHVRGRVRLARVKANHKFLKLLLSAQVCVLDYVKFSGSLGLEGKMTEYVWCPQFSSTHVGHTITPPSHPLIVAASALPLIDALLLP